MRVNHVVMLTNGGKAKMIFSRRICLFSNSLTIKSKAGFRKFL